MAEREADGFLVRGADGLLYSVRAEDVRPVPEDDLEIVRGLLDEVEDHPDAAARVDEALMRLLGCSRHHHVVNLPWFHKRGG